ncbi:MAG: cell division protein FtsB [Gammaproteobacteria bacterium]|nr:cell division protein FtsB [Gammaproteobacteria bacterium]
MRFLAVILGILLLVLQYDLWFSSGGLANVSRLERRVAEQRGENERLAERNHALEAEVRDLKGGREAIEERARSELGMIKPGETYYQIVEEPDKKASQP